MSKAKRFHDPLDDLDQILSCLQPFEKEKLLHPILRVMAGLTLAKSVRSIAVITPDAKHYRGTRLAHAPKRLNQDAERMFHGDFYFLNRHVYKT